ncbi:MAG: DsbA family protein [Gammaproteobacteria bacterium]|nr:DsbA family protein [Gammaproteobacteria bacterium]
MSKQLLTAVLVMLAMLSTPLIADEAPVRPAPEYGSSLGLGKAPARPPPALSALVPQVDIGGRPVRGDPAAPVTLVEFSDYECPYCQTFAAESWPRLKADYVDTGRLRYVVHDFPLPGHPRARAGAIAAACAGEQGKYWEMHDALFAAAGQLREQDLEAHAEQLGLDAKLFAACRAEPRHQARLDADVDAARRAGARGTPSFLVGASTGSVVRGRLLQGVSDHAALEKVLVSYLDAAEPQARQE